MTRTRFVKVSALAATVALLTGCGVHPGAAAVVGDTTISADQVDAVALALCSANAPAAQGQPVPSRSARQGALRVMLDSEVSRQFGVKEGVAADQAGVSRAIAANKAAIDQLPADERPAFRGAVEDYAAGQLVLAEVGRRYLVQHGTANPSQAQAAAAGAKLRGDFAKTLAIEVDPRFGTFTLRRGVSGTDGSLSVPASAFAMDGSATTPSATWIAALPASQKCS